jgi:mono/diheme cytochrome c family protein
VSIRGIPSYEPKDVGVTIQSTPERVAEGRRLSSMLCKDCHYSPATDKLTGHNFSEDLAQFGTIYSQNITQDKNYGIGNWTDGQLLWLLRTGIKRNGEYAPPWMPKMPHMCDEDIASIIAYLHSDDPLVQAAGVPDTPSSPSLLSKFLTNFVFKPLPYPTQPINGPDTSNKVEHGRYIVTAMLDCYPCHSANFETIDIAEPEKSGGFMGGGNMVGKNHEKEEMYSANLTPDKETGIGSWTEDQFVITMRSGKKPDGTQMQYPMVPYPQLKESEARAIYAYLMQIPPIKNKVVNTAP